MPKSKLTHNVGADMNEKFQHRLVYGPRVGPWVAESAVARITVSGITYTGMFKKEGYDIVEMGENYIKTRHLLDREVEQVHS